MAARQKHPNKDIEDAIAYAENLGWICKSSGNSSHAWGRLYCPYNNVGGCIMSIWSTPRNGINHAKQIKRKVGHCPH